MKKNFYWVLLAFAIGLIPLEAQVSDIGCGTAQAMNNFFEAHPQQRMVWQNFNEDLVANQRNVNEECDKHYVIPVVFHVFHNQGAAGVPLSQIQSALDKANDDYNGLNTDFNTVDPAFQDIRGTMKITFALASIDPDGNATTGVNYHDALSGFGNGSGYDSQISSYAWDNYKYLNIYVMNDLYNDGTTNNSGVAWYPDSWMSDNGLSRIVYNYWYLGDNGSSVADGEFQSTFTHECGHWLNLAHTFDQGCAASGDFVADTPTTQGSAGCGPNAISCGHITNGENYMDYNSSCYKMFTEGQIARMVNTLENHPARYPLWQEANLIATGTIDFYEEGLPEAEFAVSSQNISEGQTVFFEDLSCGFPTAWEWTIPGGNPSSSTDQNPSSVFNTMGVYDVSLVVTNNLGTSETYTLQIQVSENNESCVIGYDFESDAVGDTPSGWSYTNQGEDITPYVAAAVSHPWAEVGNFTSTGYLSAQSIYFPENWGESGPVELTLVTPAMDISDMQQPRLTFYNLIGWDNLWPEPKPEHTILIEAGSSVDGPWEVINGIVTNEVDFQIWQETVVDLSSYEGTIYLRFLTAGHHYYWRMDDFCLFDAATVNTNDLMNTKDVLKAYVSGEELIVNKTNYQLYNIMGQQILTHNKVDNLNVSYLNAGVYIVATADGQVQKVFIP